MYSCIILNDLIVLKELITVNHCIGISSFYNLQEFHALVDFVNPGVLGPSAVFKNVYADPIQLSQVILKAEISDSSHVSAHETLFTMQYSKCVSNPV